MTHKIIGLTNQEAKLLLKEYGLNEIPKKARHNALEIIISQFNSLLIFILIAAGLISYSFGDVKDALFIAAIIILNSALGFIQEYKAEKALLSLQKMTVMFAKVYRGGRLTLLDSRYLVPGDIIEISVGDRVPADGKIKVSHHLEIDESPLTGESLPVAKDASEANSNQIFLGTTVARGNATAEIILTGPNTKFGSIARQLSVIKEEASPLEIKLNRLGKQLSFLGIGGSIAVFFITVYQGLPLFQSLLTGVSLAVATVPEGLPAVITITLAIGTARVAGKKAIVRKMTAIETLGAVNVIATDKTGTLTQNRMEVRHYWTSDGGRNISALTKSSELTEQLFNIGILCSNAVIVPKEKNAWEIIGEQTEGSILTAAEKIGFNVSKTREQYPLINDYGFDYKNKTMKVEIKKNHQILTLLKGAPESILAISGYLAVKNNIKKITPADRKQIEDQYENYARQGYRIIAAAYVGQKPFSATVFAGFYAIADPARPEIVQSIEKASRAGIKTIMITGDNELTARAIGLETKLLRPGDLVITGDKIDKLDDVKLALILDELKIVARASPDHKLRIVKILQKKGAVVAVTGDGVNDAPALKQAHVGVAMGITGTDVAKEAADVVITDDNYTTIVTAVEEGRIIFDNIVKSVSYLIAGNLAELFTIIGAVITGLPVPLLPSQILWVNLVTDGLPAIALAVDPKGPGIMKKSPRSPEENIITLNSAKGLAAVGALMAGFTLAGFYFFYNLSGLKTGRLAAFTILITLQMIWAFAVRGRHKWFSNKFLLLAVAVSLALQAVIIFNPAISAIFSR